MKRVLISAAIFAAGLIVGGALTAQSASNDPFQTAAFVKGLGLVVSTCGTASLAAGTYQPVEISAAGNAC